MRIKSVSIPFRLNQADFELCSVLREMEIREPSRIMFPRIHATAIMMKSTTFTIMWYLLVTVQGIRVGAGLGNSGEPASHLRYGNTPIYHTRYL
jgi:hypothetical protein